MKGIGQNINSGYVFEGTMGDSIFSFSPLYTLVAPGGGRLSLLRGAGHCEFDDAPVII